jgi:hypothetical protein
MLGTWRDYCKRVTGHAAPRHYLAGYAGTNGRGVVCGQVKGRSGWHDVKPHKVVAEILGMIQ